MGKDKKKRCLIVDIDETICTPKEKYKIDIPQTIDRETWNKFLEDKEYYNPKQFIPVREIIELVENLIKSNSDIFVFFVTARENIENKPMFLNTFRLIRKFFKTFENPKLLGKSYQILMRKENDFRSNMEVKEEILHDILENYIPLLAIDDEEENIKMFERHYIPCLRVVKKGEIING